MALPLLDRPEKYEPENDEMRLLALEELVKSPGWRLVMGEAYDRAKHLRDGWEPENCGWVSKAQLPQHNRERVEANAILGILKSVRDRIAVLRERVGK